MAQLEQTGVESGKHTSLLQSINVQDKRFKYSVQGEEKGERQKQKETNFGKEKMKLMR